MKKLTFWQIWNMNIGFLGIQFSFGLQQTAVNPIFTYLGANLEDLPLLNIAGPVTGLLVQPIIGAISDKTWSPKFGRRRPFFLIGALIGSACLFVFPYSPTLWFAVGMLWILDVGNNVAMEPYRALVGDKLPKEQMSLGFQMQSLFVGAGIVLANASIFLFQDWFGGADVDESAQAIPTWLYYSFFIGAFLSLITILWSVFKTSENPPTGDELIEIEKHRTLPLLDRIKAPFNDIIDAIKEMPKFMWKLSGIYLFQWYALFIYWQYIMPMFKETMGFDNAQALSQAAKMNTTYNVSTMLFALLLVPLALKWGGKKVYVISLFLTGIAMLLIPNIQDAKLVVLPMILFGIGWAAMMGIPYSMVSKIVPTERRGVYMGILNMMIVIPMGIQTLTFGPIIKNFLHNSAVNAILLGGVFFIISGILAMRLRQPSMIKFED